MINPVPKPNHKRKAPKRSARGKFSEKVRMAILDRDDGLCRVCKRPAEEIHHVRFRSQAGRGVFTNGLSVCHHCHNDIHKDKEKADFWRNTFETLYGKDYYKDEWDS